jgi:hypothetical protein
MYFLKKRVLIHTYIYIGSSKTVPIGPIVPAQIAIMSNMHVDLLIRYNSICNRLSRNGFNCVSDELKKLSLRRDTQLRF